MATYPYDRQEEALWAEYERLQLSPERKAAARELVERKVEQAARDGVYERAAELVGTIQWSVSWIELRLEE